MTLDLRDIERRLALRDTYGWDDNPENEESLMGDIPTLIAEIRTLHTRMRAMITVVRPEKYEDIIRCTACGEVMLLG